MTTTSLRAELRLRHPTPTYRSHLEFLRDETERLAQLTAAPGVTDAFALAQDIIEITWVIRSLTKVAQEILDRPRLDRLEQWIPSGAYMSDLAAVLQLLDSLPAEVEERAALLVDTSLLRFRIARARSLAVRVHDALPSGLS